MPMVPLYTIEWIEDLGDNPIRRIWNFMIGNRYKAVIHFNY